MAPSSKNKLAAKAPGRPRKAGTKARSKPAKAKASTASTKRPRKQTAAQRKARGHGAPQRRARQKQQDHVEAGELSGAGKEQQPGASDRVHLEVVGTGIVPSFHLEEHGIREVPDEKPSSSRTSKLGVKKGVATKRAAAKLQSLPHMLEDKTSSWGSVAWESIGAPLMRRLRRLSGTA